MFKLDEIRANLKAFKEIESLDGKCPSCGFDRGYRHSYNCELTGPAREYRQNHTRYIEFLLDEIDGPPKCQSYEAECEHLGRLCEKLGLDCSCCYDREDLESLIVTAFATAQEAVKK